MSGPVVAIGFIFLIPSILGMLFSLLFIVVSIVMASGAKDAAIAGGFGTFATGFGIFFLVGSFVGGLLGWLLIMKKRVLQCSYCKASVDAA